MNKIVVAIPHSHTWFWTQTCLASLCRCIPKAKDYTVEVVVVNNSPWSPAILGVQHLLSKTDLPAYVVNNYKTNKFHASALDCVVEELLQPSDLLMAMETDVLALRPGWLQWFVDQLKPTDYAVGMWHHEQFVNPSCTLYRAKPLLDMVRWCQENKEPGLLRWGPLFGKSQPLDERTCEPKVVVEYISWVAGPFAEKRGWPAGTVLKETPSGQMKGPGWFEPGQQLHHWAVETGYTYTVCPSLTTTVDDVPVQTLYGATMPDPLRQLSATEMFGNAEVVHLWGGTRALDIIKHNVTCQFVKSNTPKWLAREARFWREVVPSEIQLETLDLIREYGWHYTGQGTDHVSARDREAAEYVRSCYREGGVEW